MTLPIEQIYDIMQRIHADNEAISDADIKEFIFEHKIMLIESDYINYYIKACKDDYQSRMLLQK